MSPVWQTIFTLFCMVVSWYWGYGKGKISGITRTIKFFKEKDLFKEGFYDEEYSDNE